MDLSNRIVQIRNSLGLSQEKFGELVDKSQRTVAAWEAGDRFPSFETLCKLADTLNVSTDYLLGRTEIPNVYLDTKKDPSPEDRKRALEAVEAASSQGSARIVISEETDIPEGLRKIVRTMIRQELGLVDKPADDQ